MKKFAIAAALLAFGCSEPPSKEPNASANVNPNNLNSRSNNATNNGTTPVNNQTSSTVLRADDFDQACDFDNECALVWGGDICGCGAICGDAIASSAVEDFEAARDAISCPPDNEPTPCPGAACQEQMAVCSSGNCEAIPVVFVEASQFDQTCEVDEECVLVATGQICDACDCGRGAINQNALEDYNGATGDPDCNPGPSPCDCAPPDQAWCNEGTCDVRFGVD